jgi:sugar/nucleoside kinase (ribokinase family)
MASAPEIVVLGDINVDIVATCARLPAAGQCIRPLALQFRPGGSAANTALALARLGRDVALLGRIGADPNAELALGLLSRAGVQLGYLQRDHEHLTGLVYTVVTPNQERATVAYQGANTSFRLDTAAEQAIRGARLLHLTGYAFLAEPQASAARAAVAVARESGVALSLDPCVAGPPGVLDELRGMLGGLSAILPNRAEAVSLSSEPDPEGALSALAARCPGLVAITLGEAGCLLARGGTTVASPAFPVQATDPTGAGDAFAAAALAGLLDQLDLEVLGILGNACGALIARCGGGSSGAPSPEELRQFLQSRLQPGAAQQRVGRAVLAALASWTARRAALAASVEAV